jgi:hypothetical protein
MCERSFLAVHDPWRAAATARRDSSKASEEVPPKSSRNSATTHKGPRKRRPFKRRECRSHYTGEEEDRRPPFDCLIAAV